MSEVAPRVQQEPIWAILMHILVAKPRFRPPRDYRTARATYRCPPSTPRATARARVRASQTHSGRRTRPNTPQHPPRRQRPRTRTSRGIYFPVRMFRLNVHSPTPTRDTSWIPTTLITAAAIAKAPAPWPPPLIPRGIPPTINMPNRTRIHPDKLRAATNSPRIHSTTSMTPITGSKGSLERVRPTQVQSVSALYSPAYRVSHSYL